MSRKFRIISIVIVAGIFFVILILIGRSSDEKSEPANMVTSVYDYTDDLIFSVHVEDASKPYSMEKAHVAGSISPRNPAVGQLDSGAAYRLDPQVCCLPWARGRLPSKLRVVWLRVFDFDLLNSASSPGYNRATSDNAPPGGRWCSAVVDIRTDGGQGGNLIFHFLNDGHLVVTSAEGANRAPLAEREVAAHTTPRSDEALCLNDAGNPWHGIPESGYRE